MKEDIKYKIANEVCFTIPTKLKDLTYNLWRDNLDREVTRKILTGVEDPVENCLTPVHDSIFTFLTGNIYIFNWYKNFKR